MEGNNIVIYHGDDFVESRIAVDGFTIKDGYTMFALEGGTATDTTVSGGGRLEVSGGTVSDTTVKTDGVMVINSGVVSKIAVNVNAQLLLNGAASDISVWSGGTMTIADGGLATDTALSVNGLIEVKNGGSLKESTQKNGTINLDGGYASDLTIKLGLLTIGKGALAEDILQDGEGSEINVLDGGHLDDVVSDGATITAASGAIISNSRIVGYSIYGSSDIFYGSLTIGAGAVHKGSLYIGSLGKVTAVAGSIIDFTLDGIMPDGTTLINDFSRISGTPDFTMTVSDSQNAGTYALAGNAAAFSAAVSLQYGECEAMALAVGGSTVYHNSVYALTLTDGTLSATVADYQTSGSASALTWGDINGAKSYAMEMSSGEAKIALEVATKSVELLGLGNGDYTWQVRNSAETDNWQTGEAFEQSEALEGPQELIASGEAPTALFFARADGVWGSGYVARNMLTGETAELAGKAKITDIFTGNDQASILLLDAFASSTQPVPEEPASGVALFLDDIYSAAPGQVPEATASGQAAARLANIDTIIASDGDDIIDLTSDRYTLAGNVTILGGDGDDVIWANSGDDVLSGGTGDDTIHGGGGNDIFCFGEGWGNDTIEQLASAENSVILWFSHSNETLQLSFTAEGNDTLIEAASGDSIRAVGMSLTLDDCRFGATGHEPEYTTLAAAGVFA